MDPQERIPRDDWADQDLLTKGEAAERLSVEITEVTAKLSGSHAGDEILQRRDKASRRQLRRAAARAPAARRCCAGSVPCLRRCRQRATTGRCPTRGPR